MGLLELKTTAAAGNKLGDSRVYWKNSLTNICEFVINGNFQPN